MGRLRFGFVIALAFPLSVLAQSHAGAARSSGTASAVPAHAAPATARGVAAPHAQQASRPAGRATLPVRSRTGGSIRHRNNFPFGSSQVDFQNVPGLGFDFAHLAAINGNHRQRGSRFNGGFPFGFGGFLLSPSIIEDPQSPQPQTVAEDQPSIDDQPSEPERHARRRRSSVQPEADSAPSPAPQPDAEQYVFVRRDGSLIFGVAYSWENGNLRYVTPEGFRRSIDSEALDLPATQQFNEQRGLSFRAPA